MSESIGFNVEKWFAPFVMKWLDHLSKQTITWVGRALESDSFIPINVDEDQKHSSSVTDLFTVVYQQLDFIKGLDWSNVVQSARFLQKFAKV
jgi:hypothetical protein